MNLEICAVIFLLIFTLVATVDGLYFHLYKYRLYAHKESIYEHHLHTINSFLFPFTVLLLFVVNSSGWLLWLAIFLTVLTLIVEFLDVFEERRSRKKFGGLTSLEYSMHFAMSGLRATYTTLILASKPFAAWSLYSSLVLYMPYAIWMKVIGISIMTLGFPIFFIHYFLGRTCARQT